MKRTREEKVIISVVYIFFIIFSITIIAPFLNIIAKAFSGYTANLTGEVFLIPVDFQTGTMLRVIKDSKFLKSVTVSVTVTTLGTICALLVSGLASYTLSRQRLMGRRFLTAAFVFTMMFSGGLIPTYLVIRALGLLDTLSVMFLPSAINVFNMLILKSAFEAVPPALEESAKIDGAGNFTIFYKIMLPAIMPSIAAVSLFFGVAYWNEYWSAMMYIVDDDLQPIQLYLLDVINQASSALDGADGTNNFRDTPESIKSATIIASTLPVLIVYPFVQKHFVQGVMLGSVKG